MDYCISIIQQINKTDSFKGKLHSCDISFDPIFYQDNITTLIPRLSVSFYTEPSTDK